MPPPMMTNVMPMLTTPMTEASRRIVSRLSMLANRSPAVMTPTMQEQQQGDDQAEVAPDRAAMTRTRRESCVRRLGGGSGADSPAALLGRSADTARPSLGVRGFCVDSLTPRLLP